MTTAGVSVHPIRRERRPAPVWRDSAEHIAALLDAAGELDREARADGQVPRRAILATLTLAGLRIGELVELRWRDVALTAGRFTVRAAKTHAGVRHIDRLPALRDELATIVRTRNGLRRPFPSQAPSSDRDGSCPTANCRGAVSVAPSLVRRRISRYTVPPGYRRLAADLPAIIRV